MIYTSPAPNNFIPTTLPSFVGASPPAYTSGGQGLVSTADDYLNFARMLLAHGIADGTRVLKPETVKLMTSNHITVVQRQFPSLVTDWKTQGFGLGISIIEDAKTYAAGGRGAGSAGSFGWGGAFGGWWQADPAEDMILIWLQEVLPPPPTAPPAPGVMPRIPGALATIAFQRAAYATRHK